MPVERASPWSSADLGGLLSRAPAGKTALIFEDNDISYAELDGDANRYANLFAGLELAPGERVSLLMSNHPLMVAAYFGCFKSGMIANPISPKLTPEEISYVLDHAQSKLLATFVEHAGLVSQALALMKAPPLVLWLDGQSAHEGNSLAASRFRDSPAVAREPAAAANRDSSDGALLLYTSGTTGRPKGVLLSHGNVLAGVDAIRVAFDIRPNERTLCVMPLSHTNALMFSTLPFLMAGATTILCARFSVSRHWDLCWKYRPTSFSASPTILRLLLDHPDGPGKNPELDYIKVASAPTPIELAEAFEARFGKGLLLETYGLTETTAINLSNPLRGKRKFGSIGRPVPPQEVRVVNEQGREMPPGMTGELVIRGPTVMQGYCRDPEATAATIRDGWVHSGDLAYADEDGYVFIVGRRKEMIIRGGENVSPLEVERVLAQHPAIREVAVVGVPDAVWGEVIGACVVRRDNVEESELIGFAGLQLASFKVPQRVVFVDELPRNGIGKVVRRSLVGLFSGKQA